MNYTKGEWKVKMVPEGATEQEGHNFLNFTDEYQIENENGIECLAVMGTAWASGKAEANAHLISAAPDMYEALFSALGAIATLDSGKGWVKEISGVITKALAKAEGKEQ